MSDSKVTQIIVDEIEGRIDNEYATSVGVEGTEELDYSIPTDRFDIVKVLDDIILGEYVDLNRDEQGFTETDGGILFKEAEGGEDQHLFEVVKVKMIGSSVKEIVVGDLVVVTKSSGLRAVDFDGTETLMFRESSIFMVLKEKQK